jgi:hypothetical protein
LERSFVVLFDDCEKLMRRDWAIKVHLCKFSEGNEKTTNVKKKRPRYHAPQTCPSTGTE